MRKRKVKLASEFSDYQEHPRFGKAPRITGLNPSDSVFSEKIFLHWHSPKGVRISNTAIEADIEKQAPATIPVTHYFDSRRVCRKCRAEFIFFAEEQKYWYEQLGFPLEADLVNCINCRRHEHKLRGYRREYERILKKENRNEEETLHLVENGLILIEESIFTKKLLPKLRGFLNNLKPATKTKTKALADRIAVLEEHEM